MVTIDLSKEEWDIALMSMRNYKAHLLSIGNTFKANQMQEAIECIEKQMKATLSSSDPQHN